MCDKKLPLVTVIVPTTHGRFAFNENVARMFHAQDYPNKQLIFDYEDGTIGQKRNRCCSRAVGEIIMHFDSDDFYVPNWISISVKALMDSGADVVGLNTLFFYNLDNGLAWKYSYEDTSLPWVAGATMCYWKKFWQYNQFLYANKGEDNSFIWSPKPRPKVYAHGYIDGFIATIHQGNTSGRVVENPRYSPCTEELENQLREKWPILKDFSNFVL